MEECWRWFGPDDAIRLPEIRQTGATGIVTALHHIPYGEVWSDAEISARKHLIENDSKLNLRWSVVESLPIHEDIKLGQGNLTRLFDNYRSSMRNLAAQGVLTICYNFMPVLDWTRTDLDYPVAGGGTSLRFDAVKYCAFDCFMLARSGAEADHDPALVARAKHWFDRAGESDKDGLLANINAGLPGAYARYDIAGLREMFARYRDVGREGLKANFARFLREIIPTAEETGIRMAVHPDDPPRPLFGLDRIVSNAEDLEFILNAFPSEANGLTFCTGSLGAGAGNNVTALAERFAGRTHFAHLRNVTKESDGSFVESAHLMGDNDMVAVIRTLLRQERRRSENQPGYQLPFRPDHGHALLDDEHRKTHPGYPLYGRMRGLAELHGVITTLNT